MHTANFIPSETHPSILIHKSRKGIRIPLRDAPVSHLNLSIKYNTKQKYRALIGDRFNNDRKNIKFQEEDIAAGVNELIGESVGEQLSNFTQKIINRDAERRNKRLLGSIFYTLYLNTPFLAKLEKQQLREQFDDLYSELDNIYLELEQMLDDVDVESIMGLLGNLKLDTPIINKKEVLLKIEQQLKKIQSKKRAFLLKGSISKGEYSYEIDMSIPTISEGEHLTNYQIIKTTGSNSFNNKYWSTV